MRQCFVRRAGLTVVAITLLIPAVSAQEASNRSVINFIQGAQSIELGYRTRDPLALVAGAVSLKRYRIEAVNRPVEVSGGGPETTKKFGALGVVTRPNDPFSPAVALGAARTLAAGDRSLLERIADAAAAKGGSEILPGNQSSHTIEAGYTHTFRLKGGRRGLREVGIIGDGDSLLVLSISSAGGQGICLPENLSSIKFCQWTANQNDDVVVGGFNRGAVFGSYRLIVN